MSEKKVAYIWEQNLIEFSDLLPAVIGRASRVHGLITAYGILEQVKVIRSTPATFSDLKLFHSDLYLEHLKTFTQVDEDYFPNTVDEEYGLGVADIVINWYGGWHHAHRFGAEGFCYVNDIVIAIEKIRLKFPKVLYIDMDVHHGNGVQDAYNISKSVFTLSFHKYEPGFYPGTGGIADIGTLNGKGYACNVPLHACCSDKTFSNIFESVFTMVYSNFMPDAIVVQCGADALASDPNGGAGLTIEGYRYCIRRVTDKLKPTLLLGGGGYNHTNAAKLWSSLTALVCNVELDENIPEHRFWPEYGPDFRLTIQPLLAKDLNTKQYIDNCISVIRGNLHRYLGSKIQDIEEPLSKKRKVEPESEPTEVNIHRILKNKLNLNCIQQSNTECNQQQNEDPYEFTD